MSCGKLIIVSLYSLSLAATTMATSTTWTNPSLGNWFISSNWSNGVPSYNEASIGNRGTAFLSDASTGVNNFGLLDGTLLVSGRTLIVQHYLQVSASDDTSAVATLEISGGGQVLLQGSGATDGVDISANGRSHGSVRVTGASSLLWAAPTLKIGYTILQDQPSIGTLTVENGATVLSGGSTGWTSLGVRRGASGSVTVTGANSTLDTQNDFEIGGGGAGSLVISNGGKVLGDSPATIATFAGSTGTVTVTGNGSLWDHSSSIFVGGSPDAQNQSAVNGGSGTLRIQAGGLVQATHLKFFNNGILEVNNGSSTVAGLKILGGADSIPPGGTLGDMVIGLTTGGRMEISGGGKVASARGYMGFNPGSTGATTVSGAGSRWDCAGSIWMGNGGAGSMEITGGAIVASAGNGYLGFDPGASGFVSVSGTDSSWTTAFNLFIGGNGNGPGGSGTLHIENGGLVSAAAIKLYQAGHLVLGANPIVIGPLNVLGGTIQASNNTTFPNNFTIETAGLTVYTTGFNLTLSGSITGAGGLVKGAGVTGTGNLILENHNNYAGATMVGNGKLLVNGSITSSVTVNGGTLGGSGDVGSVTVNSNGTVAPGNSAGRLTVNGNYTQNSGGALNIELGGLTPGSGFDQIAASGFATVAGTLNVSRINGYEPVVGDTFAIITSNGVTGNFSTINSAGLTVRCDASATGIVLTILALPPTFVVTTTNEHSDGVCDAADCSLWDAMNAANASFNSTVRFRAGVTGTITTALLTSGINIVQPVTIIGPGARNLTISGSGTGRIFYIPSGAGSVKISGLTLANGKPPGTSFPAGYGGAIFNAASLTLTDCTISGSVANVHGGAIYNNGASGNAILALTNCTLSGNSASLSGGAIFSAASNGLTTMFLTNCTVNQNSAGQYGGAIYNDGTGNGNAALTVTNCTFNQNTASLIASGIYNDALNPSNSGVATLRLRNTILRAGDARANLVNDGGTITSDGYNLSSDAAGGNPPPSTAPGGFLNATGDIRNTDPQLGSLSNNGGPTDTIALLAASLAINSGGDALAPKLDQRNYLRVGVSDRGAFEVGGLPLRITSITRLTNGYIRLQGLGVPNAVHTIEASPDLGPNSFAPLPTPATADGAGALLYDDDGAVGLTKRFYRVTFP